MRRLWEKIRWFLREIRNLKIEIKKACCGYDITIICCDNVWYGS